MWNMIQNCLIEQTCFNQSPLHLFNDVFKQAPLGDCGDNNKAVAAVVAVLTIVMA